jgi:hypothetical protein
MPVMNIVRVNTSAKPAARRAPIFRFLILALSSVFSERGGRCLPAPDHRTVVSAKEHRGVRYANTHLCLLAAARQSGKSYAQNPWASLWTSAGTNRHALVFAGKFSAAQNPLPQRGPQGFPARHAQDFHSGNPQAIHSLVRIPRRKKCVNLIVAALA